jgi:hypothetical protein
MVATPPAPEAQGHTNCTVCGAVVDAIAERQDVAITKDAKSLFIEIFLELKI